MKYWILLMRVRKSNGEAQGGNQKIRKRERETNTAERINKNKPYHLATQKTLFRSRGELYRSQ